MAGSGLIFISEKDMGTSSEEDDLYKLSILFNNSGVDSM